MEQPCHCSLGTTEQPWTPWSNHAVIPWEQQSNHGPHRATTLFFPGNDGATTDTMEQPHSFPLNDRATMLSFPGNNGATMDTMEQPCHCSLGMTEQPWTLWSNQTPWSNHAIVTQEQWSHGHHRTMTLSFPGNNGATTDTMEQPCCCSLGTMEQPQKPWSNNTIIPWEQCGIPWSNHKHHAVVPHHHSWE